MERITVTTFTLAGMAICLAIAANAYTALMDGFADQIAAEYENAFAGYGVTQVDAAELEAQMDDMAAQAAEIDAAAYTTANDVMDEMQVMLDEATAEFEDAVSILK